MKKVENKFNRGNEGNDVPEFKYFLEAFKIFLGDDKTKFKAESMGHNIHFHMEDGRLFDIETEAGLRLFLKKIIEKRSIDDIAISTIQANWEDMYDGIDKVEFLPKMLNNWEYHWSQVEDYSNKEKNKEESYRKLQLFFQLFDEGNAISIAEDIESDLLYPLAVITMLSIYDVEACYAEYISFEFFSMQVNHYESIELEIDGEEQFFQIREAEEFMSEY